MSINGIGNYNYNSSYIGANRAAQMRNQQKPAMGNAGKTLSFGITLHYTGENGDKALTAVGFPDGSSTSVYKADNYDAAEPEYRVRYWGKSGDYTDTNVRINDVDPKNASYLEMLAYSTYSDVQGYTSDAFGNFLSAAGGLNGETTYDEDNVNVKKNFMSMIKEFMQMQYDCNNLAGYLSYKKFYDYMTTNRYDKSNVGQFYQQKQAVNESVSEWTARFPLQEVDEEGNRKEEMYLTAVDKDGIRCSKPGQNEYEWEILFTDESQYKNATEFLNYAEKFMDNFLFAAHENFWEDYLNGNMDVDEFKEFLKGTNNGIPDYSFTVGDSMYIDREKMQWAQYMNPLGIKFYTAEEMAQMQAELIEKNIAAEHKLSDPYSIMKDKACTASYHEKADYLAAAYALMDDMKTLGNWDGYLRYDKWIP